VEAENSHGVGNPSIRIVFRTAKKDMGDLTADGEEDKEESAVFMDRQACCVDADVGRECKFQTLYSIIAMIAFPGLPLCAYNVSMTDVKRLAPLCASHMGDLSKCLAAGHNHMPCCERRGVPSRCQSLCQGIQASPDSSVFTDCLPYVGNIVVCLEEGATTLPDPVKNFRLVAVLNDTNVILMWDVVKGDNVTYEVYYKEVEEFSKGVNDFQGNTVVNSSQPSIAIANLTAGARYQFFAVAHNSAGSSLPSSVLVTVANSSIGGAHQYGLPTPPHRVVVSEKGTDFVELHWTAPAISHPGQNLTYTVFYRRAGNAASTPGIAGNPTKINSFNVTANHARLEGLASNALYVFYVTSVTSSGSSGPSETLLQWTDPVIPAFVETPAIVPGPNVKEGTSFSVLCIAMGSPKPTVTLYLSGHPIRSEVTRHMVTTLTNATRFMRK